MDFFFFFPLDTSGWSTVYHTSDAAAFTARLDEHLGSQAALSSPRAEFCIALLFSLPFLQQNCGGKQGEPPWCLPSSVQIFGS